MGFARDSLEIKRRVITRLMDQGLFPYTQRYLRHWNNHFSTIGLIGMNESTLNFMGKDLTHPEAREFAMEVLKHMREKLVAFQEETGHLYNLEATPGEGTTYRLAKIDRQKFTRMIIPGGESPYYTNSTQLPVNATDDVFEALDMQNDIQRLYTGGTVFHCFIGESIDDAETCKSLVKKIASNYEIPYFTISPTFSVCQRHGYLKGEQFSCPNCGEETEVYSRIVGYYRPVQNWNCGKKSEYRERKVSRSRRRRGRGARSRPEGGPMRSILAGVAGWQKNSFIDFPGTVSTVLFFSGCNLKCPYCHNPHIVKAGPDGGISSDDIWDLLEKRKKIIEGVVLSGGEPTLHACLAYAVPDIKQLGFRVKLDTNGMLPEKITSLLPDYLALDVKTAPRLYRKLLFSPYADAEQRIARSVGIARDMGDKAEIRITVAPGIVGRSIIREIGELINGVKKVFLQPMQKKRELLDPEIMKEEMIPAKEISLYRDILSEFVGECVVRGENV